MRVALLPLGDVPEGVLGSIVATLTASGIPCGVRGSRPLPPEAFAPRKGQWDAERVLQGLPRSPSETLVAVTGEDLFVEGMNFVFGLADTGGGVALVSVARLRSRDPAVTQNRLLKEVIHELGHTLGMAHCKDRACVMHFSNSIGDTDAKGTAFCAACAARLPMNAAADLGRLRTR